MIKSRTTLILGAGASAPYGFPIGSALRDDLLKTDGIFNVKLKEASLDVKAWVEIQDLLHRYQSSSVDDFLRVYSEHADYMKIAIAFQLNRHERLKEHQNPNHSDPWYRVLLDEVLENDPKLGDGALSIVTFNYEMSLEHYLAGTLQVRHRLEEEEANEALTALNFQHIYGAIGPALNGHHWSRPYGEFPSTRHLQTAANGISTCFEPKSREAVAVARKLIAESKNLLFLGFGYSAENLKRLDLLTCVQPHTNIVASQFQCHSGFERLRQAIGGVPVALRAVDDDGRHGTVAVNLTRLLFDGLK
ncbi:MAG TPA: hypothetical protein VNZ02_16470 [Steroidobacteraceae bacterium]|jgi:hypothetical protein|nr:hypothetical protein [Steroidobacteraceae bacterium]